MNKENCALKLVDEIILYYDARSKKHQIYAHKDFTLCLKFCYKEFEKTGVNGIRHFANNNATVLVRCYAWKSWDNSVTKYDEGNHWDTGIQEYWIVEVLLQIKVEYSVILVKNQKSTCITKGRHLSPTQINPMGLISFDWR